MGRGRYGKKCESGPGVVEIWQKRHYGLPALRLGNPALIVCHLTSTRATKGHTPCSARGGRAQEGRTRSPHGEAKSRPASQPAAENFMETAGFHT